MQTNIGKNHHGINRHEDRNGARSSGEKSGQRRRSPGRERRRGAALLGAILLAFVTSTGAPAEVYTDTFETGNPSGWAFIRGGDIIENSGGNPGRWLHQPTYDTFGPSLETFPGLDIPFHGDYRANNVSRIAVDARIDHTDFGSEGFELTLILRNTNGTPSDVSDDDYAYFVDGFVPPEGAGWVHYDFDVPSQSNDPVPAGWKGAWLEDCENFRPGVSWADLMTNVDQVEFWFIDPCLFAIFQQWNVGADNPTIEFGDPTPVEEPEVLAGGLSLVASPSPATGPVRLEYALSRNDAGVIDVFDVVGRAVARFAVTGGTGAVQWNGFDESGRQVAPGIYLARLSTARETTTARIAFLR